jgi:hypothetical protein
LKAIGRTNLQQLHFNNNPARVHIRVLPAVRRRAHAEEVVHGRPVSGSAHALEDVQMSARMASRPRQVTVWYRGIPYTLDLVRCRRALVARQVDGDLDSMESLANAVGISRSTASRFFSGRPTSLAVTLRILEALHLRFDEVATPAVEDQAG